MISWLFVFCCGTGHILWSLLPIINEIAIENGVRPERPIALLWFPAKMRSAALRLPPLPPRW